MFGDDLNPRKKRKLNRKNLPEFFLNRKGQSAQICTRNATTLSYEDITNLILYASTKNSFNKKPCWCELMHRTKLSCLNVVVVEDVGMNDLIQCDENKCGEDSSGKSGSKLLFLQKLRSISTAAVVVSPPKNSIDECIDELYRTDVPGSKIDNCESFYRGDHILREDIQSILETTDKFDRTQLLLSLKQLEMLECPLKKREDSQGYDAAIRNSRPFYNKVTSSSPMFAVDCEMVMTENHPRELAQISVVDENLKVLYTSIVKPEYNITNYMTCYSGLTEDDFVGVKTKLKDVQVILSELLPPDAILIGHSLNSDLNALKLCHPYCIDTSLIYNLADYTRLRPSLKNASKFFLNVEIQQIHKWKVGHDPTEDAIAAMVLVKKKLDNFLNFGDTAIGWIKKIEIINTKPVKATVPKNSIFEVSKYSKKPTVILHAKRKVNVLGNATVIIENDNKTILNKTSLLSFSEKLTISHIKIKTESSSFRKKIEELDGQLKNLYDSIPLCNMLIVLFTGSYTSEDCVSNGCAFISVKDS